MDDEWRTVYESLMDTPIINGICDAKNGNPAFTHGGICGGTHGRRQDMETININGTEYVKCEDALGGYPMDTCHVCVIAPNGWIFEGYRTNTPEQYGDALYLTDAHVVRRWSNGLGIGGLADPDHKDDYTLDAVGDVAVMNVNAVIPLRW